jgi:hypothetical protein
MVVIWLSLSSSSVKLNNLSLSLGNVSLLMFWLSAHWHIFVNQLSLFLLSIVQLFWFAIFFMYFFAFFFFMFNSFALFSMYSFSFMFIVLLLPAICIKSSSFDRFVLLYCSL